MGRFIKEEFNLIQVIKIIGGIIAITLLFLIYKK